MTVALLAGPIAVGKSAVAQALSVHVGAQVLSARDLLLTLTEAEEDRRSLQLAGADLDRRTHGRWMLEALNERAPQPTGGLVIVDAVRTIRQTEPVLNARNDCVLIFLEADEPTRRLRFQRSALRDAVKRTTDFGASAAHPTETHIRELRRLAHIIIDTTDLSLTETVQQVTKAPETLE